MRAAAPTASLKWQGWQMQSLSSHDDAGGAAGLFVHRHGRHANNVDKER